MDPFLEFRSLFPLELIEIQTFTNKLMILDYKHNQRPEVFSSEGHYLMNHLSTDCFLQTGKENRGQI